MTKMILHQVSALQFSPQVDRTSRRSAAFRGALWAAMITLNAGKKCKIYFPRPCNVRIFN